MLASKTPPDAHAGQSGSSGPHRNRVAAIGDLLFCLVLGVILCISPLARLTRTGAEDLAEKRPLAAAPSLPSTLAQWAAFPAAADQYLNDHFGFRAEMISLNAYLRYRAGISASSRVLVGRSGWLFFVDDPAFHFFRGRLLPEAELRRWAERMEKRRSWLAVRGIRFLILPAPRKESIYPEFLPGWLRMAQVPTIVDQVKATPIGRTAVIDVRKRLIARKQNAPVYTPYDFHWTAEGAFTAYQTLMEEISRRIPGTACLQRDSIRLTPAPPQRGDLVDMLGICRFLNVTVSEYIPRSNGRSTVTYLSSRTDDNSQQLIATGSAGPRIMLVRDSFAVAMLPYLLDSFSAVGMTHLQDGIFPEEYILRCKPDVVVLEVQENAIGII